MQSLVLVVFVPAGQIELEETGYDIQSTST
jgi:hypothetical protein